MFVVSSSGNVSLMKVYTGTSILMIALVLTIALLMVFPQLALWLPNTTKEGPDWLAAAAPGFWRSARPDVWASAMKRNRSALAAAGRPPS